MESDNQVPPYPRFKSDDEVADELFDAVSESLRDHTDTCATNHELRESQKRADAAFQTLHDWIIAARSLPDPWRRHYAPRGPEHGQ